MSEPQQPYGPPPGLGGGSTPSGAGQPAGQPWATEPRAGDTWTGGAWSAGTGPGQPAYGPPGAPLAPGGQPPHQGPTETEAKAVVAVVLAVLAYTPVVPFVGAIAALVLARYARRDIERSGGAKTGLGLVKAARVLAWVHLLFVCVLVVLAVVVLVLPIGLGLSPGL